MGKTEITNCADSCARGAKGDEGITGQRKVIREAGGGGKDFRPPPPPKRGGGQSERGVNWFLCISGPAKFYK